MKKPKGYHWRFGAFGIWRTNNETDGSKMYSSNNNEKKFLHRTDGQMGRWFGTHSTACKAAVRGPSLAASWGQPSPMQRLHVGTDKAAVVRNGHRLLKHLHLRSVATLEVQIGGLRLGSILKNLRRELPWKKPFAYIKDGDLWRHFTSMIKVKRLNAIKISKVKGHATNAMVEE